MRAYHETFGLPVLVTNCSNNYGPYQFPEKLIPLMILNALEGSPLPIYGDGGNVRDWLYVEDHCAGILLVLRQGRAGREVQHRRRQRAHATSRSSTRSAPLLEAELPPRAGNPALRARGSASYARAEGLRPRPPGPRPALRHRRRRRSGASSAGPRATTFESGLRRTVRWYLDNSAWCQAVQKGKYERQRLGLG